MYVHVHSFVLTTSFPLEDMSAIITMANSNTVSTNSPLLAKKNLSSLVRQVFLHRWQYAEPSKLVGFLSWLLILLEYAVLAENKLLLWNSFRSQDITESLIRRSVTDGGGGILYLPWHLPHQGYASYYYNDNCVFFMQPSRLSPSKWFSSRGYSQTAWPTNNPICLGTGQFEDSFDPRLRYLAPVCNWVTVARGAIFHLTLFLDMVRNHELNHRSLHLISLWVNSKGEKENGYEPERGAKGNYCLMRRGSCYELVLRDCRLSK